MDFEEWLGEQDKNIQLTNHLYDQKERDLENQIREHYNNLFQFEEKTRKLTAFSESIARTISKKEEIAKFVTSVGENSIVRVTNVAGELEDICPGQISLEIIHAAAHEFSSILNDMHAITNQLAGTMQ